MPRALDVALVPLGFLPHVEHLDLVIGEESLELVDLDRLELLVRLRVREVAAQLEEPDRAQAARRLLGVLDEDA